jgi:mannose-6-phosphate isomerase-like protein (cupin superfamily)
VFENIIVRKNWGREYLLYQNDNIELWHLFIDYGHRTSLHAHPNKKTGLIVINGQCKLNFINSSLFMETGDKIIIRSGVFHQTVSLTHPYLELLEIETPKNKNDLIRLEDDYGRAGQPYEGVNNYEQYEIPDLFAINKIGNCNINIITINNDEFEFNKLDKIVVLEGRIFCNGYTVLEHGDIIDGINFKRLYLKFNHTFIKILKISK